VQDARGAARQARDGGGQTSGALVIDLVAPAPGEAVTVGTVIGVVLTMAAVAISGRGRRDG
jgi:hypothetical protein